MLLKERGETDLMRLSALHAAAALSGAAVLLSACSSAPQSSAIALPPIAVSGNHAKLPLPSVREHPSATRTVYAATSMGDVYELSYSHRAFMQFGELFVPGTGLWVDREKNVYLDAGPSIKEFNSMGDLIFTYGYSEMLQSVAVATDRFGNVYQSGLSLGGNVAEFAEGVEPPVATCVVSGVSPLPGVAVDKSGDVFVSSGSQIVEYPRGLIASNCNATVLPITLSRAGGMAIDKQDDLVVCDRGAATVDIIAPPYTSITGTLGSGWQAPGTVTITKGGTQAYVTDWGTSSNFGLLTRLLKYPSGSIVATLDQQQGGVVPVDVVDTDNYAP
jgi:hypothetical protein